MTELIEIVGHFGPHPFRKVRLDRPTRRRRRIARDVCTSCNYVRPVGSPHFCYTAYRNALRRYIANLQTRMLCDLLAAEE